MVAITTLSKALAAVALGLLFLALVIRNLRTGTLKPSVYDRVYTRAKDPGTHWFHILVFAVVGLAVAGAGLATRFAPLDQPLIYFRAAP